MLSKKVREIFPHIIIILVSLILGMLIFNLVYSKTPLDTKVVLNRKAIIEGIDNSDVSALNGNIEDIEESMEKLLANGGTIIAQTREQITKYNNLKSHIHEEIDGINLDDYIWQSGQATIRGSDIGDGPTQMT